MSETAAQAAVHAVCEVVADNSKEMIKWPDAARQRVVEEGFRAMKGFPGVIGAIGMFKSMQMQCKCIPIFVISYGLGLT